MITTYKSYIKGILTGMGFTQANVYESEDAFGRTKATPWAVILFQPEQLKEKSGKAALWENTQTGKKCIRKQKFERITVLEITFGDRTEEAVEGHVVELLKKLDTGIDDGEGNFVRIEPKQSKWLTNESVLKAKAGVVLFIQFTGGIFVDEEIAQQPTGIKVNPQIGGI